MAPTCRHDLLLERIEEMNDERTTLLTWRDYLTRRTELEGKSPVPAIVEHPEIDPEERRTWDDWQAFADDAGDDPHEGRHRA
jgi:hypothetical protein